MAKPQAKKNPTRKSGARTMPPRVSGKAIMTLMAALLVLTVATLIYQRQKPFLPQELNASVFNDIAESDKDLGYMLSFLDQKKIMTSYADGNFKPEQKVNRAEFTKILITAFAKEEMEAPENPCFNDVAMTEWFAKYVCSAKTKGWVGGYSDGSFKPSQEITQPEMLKMAMVAAAWNTSEAQTQKLPKAVDEKAWFGPYYKMAMVKNVMDAKDFSPKKAEIRKEVAMTIFKMLFVDTMKIAYDSSKMKDFFQMSGAAYVLPKKGTPEVSNAQPPKPGSKEPPKPGTKEPKKSSGSSSTPKKDNRKMPDGV
jgi:hypothetical protein